jgi:putative ABC transport system substrate-binding protein
VWPHALDAFGQGLRELGWVEGKNLAIEYRWAEGRFERLPGFVDELLRLKVDVIVAAAALKSPAFTMPGSGSTRRAR